MHITRTFLATAVALAGCLLLTGCPLGSASTATIATAVATGVTVAQGNGQTAQAGRLLSIPIVLRVVDANGRGVAKQVATLVVTGGGSVDFASAMTDSSGEVRVRWTLGTVGQLQSLVATVNGTLAVTVGATAIFPSDIVVAQGAGQSAKIVTALKNDVVVRIVGPGNIPMVGIAVTFKVTSGGGGISPQSGVTSALGEIATKWTMGSAAGTNLLVATSGDLPPTTISATAVP